MAPVNKEQVIKFAMVLIVVTLVGFLMAKGSSLAILLALLALVLVLL